MGANIDLDDAARVSLTAMAELGELRNEIVLLRRVFENARSILQHYSVDKKRFFEAYDNLDDSCEMVKRFDEGNDDA
jgi:hypothetical protein